MSIQVSTSTNANVPFYFTQEENLFKLSDGTLVCFFCKDYPYLYYAVSINNGESWTVTNFNKGAISLSCVQEGNNFIVALSPSSTSAITCKTLTYNALAHTFSIADTSTISSYGVGSYSVKFLYQDNLYICISLRNNYRTIYCYISSNKTSWSTNEPSALPDSPFNSARNIDAILFDTNKILLTVSTSSGKLYYYIGTKGESNYSWVGATQINDIAIDPILTDYDALTLYKVSDTEIYLACRTSNGYVFYTFNGSTWSSPVSMSPNTGDISGRFTKVNGIHVWSYLNVEQQPDTSYLYSINYRLKKSTGWGTEDTIVPQQVKKIRRFTVEITENTESILRYLFSEESSSPYKIYFDAFSLPEGEKIDIEESLLVSESIENNVSQEYLNIEETVHLAENVENDVSNEYFNVNELLEVSDNIYFDTDALINVNESISFYDEIESITNRRVIDIEEFLTVSDNNVLSNLSDIKFISKIISYNPLIVVTNENPPKLFLIEITQESGEEEETYTWTPITLTELSSLIDLKHNPYNEYLYAIDENNLLKINDDDYEDRILINLESENGLKELSLLDNRLKSFITTDSETGELITLEEAEISSVPLDIRVLIQDISTIPMLISTVKGQKLPTDIRVLKQNIVSLGLDVRILKYDFSKSSQYPIDFDDIDFKINGVSIIGLNDLDLQSVTITHNIEEEKSTATFKLHRRFDDLNKTFGGVSSVITNKNTVQIYIKGIKEFEGKISNINVQSESEEVRLTAVGNRPSDKRNSITVPFSSLNADLHLYDCLLSNITIDNPYIDPTIDYEKENLTPDYYLGIKIDRGIKREQRVSRWLNMNDVLDYINNGTFQPTPNWSYFWYVGWKALDINSFGNPMWVTGTQHYIGTSLSPLSSQIIELDSAHYHDQRIYDDDITNLGYYYLGEAPYMEVSCRNGVYITKNKWEDRANGLYRVKDESYDFTNYVTKVASIEYQKLKNINGTVLPIVNCDVHLSLDSYYFYDIKLLKRLNFSNTTLSNIYNNLNGFPVSVKLINITFNDMKVNLQCSNQWSSVELKEFDEELPDEENYIRDEDSALENYKYDVATMARVF